MKKMTACVIAVCLAASVGGCGSKGQTGAESQVQSGSVASDSAEASETAGESEASRTEKTGETKAGQTGAGMPLQAENGRTETFVDVQPQEIVPESGGNETQGQAESDVSAPQGQYKPGGNALQGQYEPGGNALQGQAESGVSMSQEKPESEEKNADSLAEAGQLSENEQKDGKAEAESGTTAGGKTDADAEGESGEPAGGESVVGAEDDPGTTTGDESGTTAGEESDADAEGESGESAGGESVVGAEDDPGTTTGDESGTTAGEESGTSADDKEDKAGADTESDAASRPYIIEEKILSGLMKTAEGEYVTVKAGYPVISGENAGAEAINTALKDYAAAWMEEGPALFEAEYTEDASAETTWFYELDYKITCNDGKLLGVLFTDTYYLVDAAHPLGGWDAFIFDAESGKVKGIRDFISGSDQEIFKLAETVLADAKAHGPLANVITPEFDLSLYASVDEFNIYIDDEGVWQYFGLYEAGAFADGIISVQLSDTVGGTDVESQTMRVILGRPGNDGFLWSLYGTPEEVDWSAVLSTYAGIGTYDFSEEEMKAYEAAVGVTESDGERPEEVLESAENDVERPGEVLESDENDVEGPGEVLESDENDVEGPGEVLESAENDVEGPGEVLESDENDVERPGEVLKITDEELRAFVLEKTGTDYEEAKKPLDWIYLEKYDAWYGITEARSRRCRVLSVEEADGRTRVLFSMEKLYDGKTDGLSGEKPDGSETDEASGTETDEVFGSETDEASGAETDEASGAETDEAPGAETDEASGAETDDAEAAGSNNAEPGGSNGAETAGDTSAEPAGDNEREPTGGFGAELSDISGADSDGVSGQTSTGAERDLSAEAGNQGKTWELVLEVKDGDVRFISCSLVPEKSPEEADSRESEAVSESAETVSESAETVSESAETVSESADTVSEVG